MKKLQLLIFTFSAFLFTSIGFLSAQQDFDAVEIQIEQLAENIYMFTGAGGNIGVSVGDDGVIMIDDQYAPLSGKIQAAIGEITIDPVRFVLNTHWHGDHTGGNEEFAKTGSLIIAHENVRSRMSTDQIIEAFGMEVPPSPDVALPVITFDDDLMLHLNDEDILVMHYHQAHTDGDAFVYFTNSNVIHMGDTYFNGGYPFIDVSTGGSIDGMIKWINNVLLLINSDTKVIPGHGASSNQSELVAYRNMLQTVRDLVKAGIDAGKSLEAIKASDPLADFNDHWGEAFLPPDQFLDIVFTSLKGGKQE